MSGKEEHEVEITCSQTLNYRRQGKMRHEELAEIAHGLMRSCRNVLQPGDVGCDERRHLVDGDPLDPDDVEIIVDGKRLCDDDLEMLAREEED